MGAEPDLDRVDHLLHTLASRLRTEGSAESPLSCHPFGRLVARRDAARALAARGGAAEEVRVFLHDLSGDIRRFLPETPTDGVTGVASEYRAIGHAYLVEGRSL